MDEINTTSTDQTADNHSSNIVLHEYTKSIVALKTPVLFSTSRGIHIRRTVSVNPRNPTDYTFKAQHCDLEQFQYATVSKRVNTIGLTPDTSTISSKITEKSVREQQIRPKNVRFVNEQRSGS